MNMDDTYVDSSVRIGFKQYLEGPQKLTKKKGTDTFTNLMCIFKSNKNDCIHLSETYEYYKSWVKICTPSIKFSIIYIASQINFCSRCFFFH